MTDRLDGMVAVITGAATGIGRAMALRFASEGCAGLVLATSRNMAGLAAVVAEIDGVGRGGNSKARAVACRADVSLDADIRAVVQSALDRFGRLNVLVNNAAHQQASAPADQLTEEAWDRTVDVTLKGAFLGAKHAIPAMLATAGRGSVVNVSSVNSFIHAPGLPAYSAAKGGLDALTRQLALEYGPRRARERGQPRTDCCRLATWSPRRRRTRWRSPAS